MNFFPQKMIGEDNFSFYCSSLNEISLYLKQKKAWIHRWKVLDSLCSRSCIDPFKAYYNFTTKSVAILDTVTSIDEYGFIKTRDGTPNPESAVFFHKLSRIRIRNFSAGFGFQFFST